MIAQAETVVRFSAAQTDAAVQVLTRAFFEDPMIVYMLPNAAERRARSPWFFRVSLRLGQQFGQVYTTPGAEGCAIWLSPANTTISLGHMVRTGLLVMPFTFGWAGFMRFMTINGFAEKAHKQSVSGAHWYLLGLGVDPAKQGQGMGGRLMQPIFARAEAEGVPCYLETVNEKNVPFYQKHGFVVKFSGQVPQGGPHFWAMVRPPS